MQKMKLSLTKKTIIWIVIVTIIVGIISIAVYNKGAYDLIIAQYEHYSIDMTKLISVELDSNRVLNIQKTIKDIYERSENKVKSDQWGSPEFESYVAQFEFVKEMEDYKIILADLQRMQSQLDVDCLYLTWVDVENKCYIYLVDAALEEPCPPGCIDPLYFSEDIADKILSNLKTNGIPPNISKTEEYGWLMATGMPIYDNSGNVIAMADVDISMNAAMNELKQFMNFIVYAFILIAIIVCVLAIVLIRRRIINPIITMSNAALQYKDNSTVFSSLNIKRNDEIGILANSMTQMGNDINKYINDLTSARDLANEMDQVANTDALSELHRE